MSVRPKERHRTGRIGWLRAAVLGANDGIVSTAGNEHEPSMRGPSQTIRLERQPRPTAVSHHQASIAADPLRRIASAKPTNSTAISPQVDVPIGDLQRLS